MNRLPQIVINHTEYIRFDKSYTITVFRDLRDLSSQKLPCHFNLLNIRNIITS